MKKFLVALLLLLIISGIVGYSLSQPKSAHILITGVVLTVEIAETATSQEKGLSGRSSLPNDHGMLFIFDHQDYWGFWMMDMRFSLDIIWFNSDRQAIFVEQALAPCTPQKCPIFPPNVKAVYVLEVNAGFVAAHQITLGTPFVFLGL